MQWHRPGFPTTRDLANSSRSRRQNILQRFRQARIRFECQDRGLRKQNTGGLNELSLVGADVQDCPDLQSSQPRFVEEPIEISGAASTSDLGVTRIAQSISDSRDPLAELFQETADSHEIRSWPVMTPSARAIVCARCFDEACR